MQESTGTNYSTDSNLTLIWFETSKDDKICKALWDTVAIENEISISNYSLVIFYILKFYHCWFINNTRIMNPYTCHSYTGPYT